MMKLKEITIQKYKCIETEQQFNVENDITILVGMNESGKTSVLEAIAKTNYFQEDAAFKFNTTHDYPRKEKKKLDKSGIDAVAVTAIYSIDDALLKKIAQEVGSDVFTQTSISVSTKFSNSRTWNDFTGKSLSFNVLLEMPSFVVKFSINFLLSTFKSFHVLLLENLVDTEIEV